MVDQDGWQSISLKELRAEINGALDRMNATQRKLWDVIRVTPEKWQQDPYGKEGGGFWVVALIGTTVVWYNDIEDGFNRSRYSRHGIIDEYWCNQDELGWAIEAILKLIETGQDTGRFGPPRRLDFRAETD
jgi:hypothetical protein